ncbi:hypothetical protein FA95DRAFT_1558699 [Auriscalpium vulgare]|uniref:Uncharacterized protein n=1 Tax=Auriscalpium vulgare TaxID=40419 RepID=A0ACB8RUT9_9AGAM|nr:hypothetical protein FA95DRAFT_1558699 [Auriscalpium vulgare]
MPISGPVNLLLRPACRPDVTPDTSDRPSPPACRPPPTYCAHRVAIVLQVAVLQVAVHYYCSSRRRRHGRVPAASTGVRQARASDHILASGPSGKVETDAARDRADNPGD